VQLEKEVQKHVTLTKRHDKLQNKFNILNTELSEILMDDGYPIISDYENTSAKSSTDEYTPVCSSVYHDYMLYHEKIKQQRLEEIPVDQQCSENLISDCKRPESNPDFGKLSRSNSFATIPEEFSICKEDGNKSEEYGNKSEEDGNKSREGGNGNISKENGNVSDEGSTISIEDTSCSDESFDDEEIIFNSNISVEDLDKRFLEKCQLYQMSLLTGEKYEDMEKVSKKKKKEVLQEKSNRFDTSLLNQQYNEKRLANIINRSSDLLSDKSALDLFTSPSDKEILLASKKSNNNQFLSYLDKAQSYLEKMTIHSTTNELFNEESNRREASERKNDEIKSYYVFNEENTRKEKGEKR